MAKRDAKQKAVELRQKGVSYSKIREELCVSKSTLSLWLREYPLTKKQVSNLVWNNNVRIEKFRNTMSKKRASYNQSLFALASSRIGEMSKREIMIAGTFLFWGEGSKTKDSSFVITNTDPAMIRFCIAWLKQMSVPISRLKFNLHIYADMDADESITFWANQLGVKADQFRRPYIKKVTRLTLSNKGLFGRGTCSLVYQSTHFTKLIKAYLEVIKSKFNNQERCFRS